MGEGPPGYDPFGLAGDELFVDFIHPKPHGHQVIGDAIVRALRDRSIPRAAATWNPFPDPPPVEAIFAARPDYRLREAETRLAACLLTRRAACIERRAHEVLSVDPEHAAARSVLAHRGLD